MSVLIKDMEMPKDGVYWCEISVADDIAMITIHGEDRKSFPLVPVPPQECEKCIFKPFKQFQPEQKKGKWIFVNKFRGQHKCSVCGVVAVQARNGFHLESSPTDNTGEHAIVIDHYKEFLSDYCPNCGARMEVKE